MLKTFANNFFNSITHLSINRSSFGRIKSIAVESKPSTSARMEYIFRSLSQLFASRNQTQNKRSLPVLCCCSILTFKLLSHHSPLPENTVLHCCHIIVLCICVCVFVYFFCSPFFSRSTPFRTFAITICLHFRWISRVSPTYHLPATKPLAGYIPATAPFWESVAMQI